MKQVTIRDLLTHAKAFREYDGDQDLDETGRVACYYQNMKASVKDGVLGVPSKSAGYQNINYGLFRVLIPYMIQDGGIPEKAPAIPKLERIRTKLGPEGLGTFEDFLGVLFVQHVRAEILIPADIAEVGVLAPYGDGAPPATRYYACPQDPTSQGDSSQPFRTVGGTDWKMSCKTFMKLLVGLAKGSVASPSKVWNVMLNSGFGLGRYDGIPGHGGDGHDARLHTGWICGPSLHPGQGVIAIAMINSDIDGTDYYGSSVLDRLLKIYPPLAL